MKEIETSKCRFVVLNESDLDFKEKKGITYVYNNKRLIDWHNRIKLSEITEEEASSIVDLFSLQYDKYKKVYKLYNLENIKHTFNPIDSLHSLLESQGIEITNNTYIFKI